MYNDTIKVANKIIKSEDLYEIFCKMNEELNKYLKIFKSEQLRNQSLDYSYKVWTFNDSGSKLKFSVDFYDDTQIDFDNFNNFISIFNSRLEEIKSIDVYYVLSYEVKNPNNTSNDGYRSQRIHVWIREEKMDIEASISSEDDKMNEVYELIKNKILNSQVKYDKVIKDKSKISLIVNSAIGFMPSIIIVSLLLLVPTVRKVLVDSYVLYPICVMFLTLLLGGVIGSSKIDSLYRNIVPEKKYVGYKDGPVYKDDIDKYLETSEILIGNNTNNLKNREDIVELYNKYKKYLPYELLTLLIASIVVICLGLL